MAMPMRKLARLRHNQTIMSTSQQEAIARRAEADRIVAIIADVSYLFSGKAQNFLRQIASTRGPVSERQLVWLRNLREQFYSG